MAGRWIYYDVCGNRRGKQTEIDYEIMSEFLHISMQLTTQASAEKSEINIKAQLNGDAVGNAKGANTV